jgi:hypothetical protein
MAHFRLPRWAEMDSSKAAPARGMLAVRIAGLPPFPQGWLARRSHCALTRTTLRPMPSTNLEAGNTDARDLSVEESY